MYKYKGMAICITYDIHEHKRMEKFCYSVFGNSKQLLIEDIKSFVDKFAHVDYGDLMHVYVVECSDKGEAQHIIWQKEVFKAASGLKKYRKPTLEPAME